MSASDVNLTFNALLAKCFHLAAVGSGPAPPPQPNAPSAQSAPDAPKDPALHLVSLLDLAARRADQLSLISIGQESLREVSTGALRSLFIPSLKAEAESNVRTSFDARSERKRRLANSKSNYKAFLKSLRLLKILPLSTESLLRAHAELYASKDEDEQEANQVGTPKTTLPPNAALAASAKRRETKIALFKTERSLKASLEAFRATNPKIARDAGKSGQEDVYYDPLIPSETRSGKGDDEEDEEEEDERDDIDAAGIAGSSSDPNTGTPKTLRAYVLLLLNLHAVKASTNLESTAQELELLGSMPSDYTSSYRPPGEDGRDRARDAADASWRLDRGPGGSASNAGPLMDDKGKPLRPFTITASEDKPGAVTAQDGPDLSARERLRQEVFRPGHRLPTMSIDEYLEEERRRGNIIEGGGEKSMTDPTPRESRALRAQGEDSGTAAAEEAEEEKRREAIEWDDFKEANPKGAGNTMNRG